MRPCLQQREYKMETTRTLLKAMRQLSVIDSAMPVPTAMVLLYVAAHENKVGGLSSKDIREALGLTIASGSRQVLYWADATSGSSKVSGKGYLTIRTDPTDARRTNISLSAKGRAFINSLEGL